MALLTRDFTGLALPNIVKGVPIGRGFLHGLTYVASANLNVDDDLMLKIKVPTDEHWYILQWLVDDNTLAANHPNGWKAQWLAYNLERGVSPTASVADPTPQGKFNEPTTAPGIGLKTWLRWWDGSTYIAWEDYAASGISNAGTLIVRCTDPVWCMPRVPPGVIMNLLSSSAETASGAELTMAWEMIVLRFRLEDYDHKRLVRENGAEAVALTDVHMQQHRPILGD